MDGFPTQLRGHIRFGFHPGVLTDRDAEFHSLVINTQLQTATRPKTYAQPEEQQLKSGTTHSLTLNFSTAEHDPTGFWSDVWDAQTDDLGDLAAAAEEAGRRPGELYFTARYQPGPADPDTNPEFGGWVLCSDLDTGQTVGETKGQQKTWPARDVVKLGTESS